MRVVNGRQFFYIFLYFFDCLVFDFFFFFFFESLQSADAHTKKVICFKLSNKLSDKFAPLVFCQIVTCCWNSWYSHWSSTQQTQQAIVQQELVPLFFNTEANMGSKMSALQVEPRPLGVLQEVESRRSYC